MTPNNRHKIELFIRALSLLHVDDDGLTDATEFDDIGHRPDMARNQGDHQSRHAEAQQTMQDHGPSKARPCPRPANIGGYMSQVQGGRSRIDLDPTRIH